jgi:competence protein ComEC
MASANAGIGLHVVAAAAAHWLWLALELAATMPGAALDLARPTPAAELVAVVAVAIGLSWHWLPGRQLALLGILPIGFQPVSQLAAGVVRLTVLDVGHGLAVAIETASHRALYDAGPMYRSGFDAGAEVVGPALAALGTNDLDVLIVSHGDSDHAGGAAAIIERYPRARRLVGPDVELAGAERCLAGQHWVWDGVRFTMLHPPAGFTPIGNESSCVLKIEAAGASALLTGDIEGRAEARVLGAAAVGADVVLMPHHGSLTSSSQAFVDAVGARIAIASAGFDNRWDFPRPVVRQRWEDSGAIVLVTGDDGAIDLVLGRDSIDYRSARDDDRRYWRRDRELVSGAIALSAL